MATVSFEAVIAILGLFFSIVAVVDCIRQNVLTCFSKWSVENQSLVMWSFRTEKEALMFIFCWKLLRCWLQFHRDAKISRCLVLSSGRAVWELQEGWVREPPWGLCYKTLRIPFLRKSWRGVSYFNYFIILPRNGYGENGCVNFLCKVLTFCKKRNP